MQEKSDKPLTHCMFFLLTYDHHNHVQTHDCSIINKLLNYAWICGFFLAQQRGFKWGLESLKNSPIFLHHLKFLGIFKNWKSWPKYFWFFTWFEGPLIGIYMFKNYVEKNDKNSTVVMNIIFFQYHVMLGMGSLIMFHSLIIHHQLQ